MQNPLSTPQASLQDVKPAVGRTRGSGLRRRSTSNLPRERPIHATSGPPVEVNLERARARDDACDDHHVESEDVKVVRKGAISVTFTYPWSLPFPIR